MALNIKSCEADELARELAKETGESLTVAVLTALRERLARLQSRRARRRLRSDIARILERYRQLPIKDMRPADEILGFEDSGLPN